MADDVSRGVEIFLEAELRVFLLVSWGNKNKSLREQTVFGFDV